MNHYPDAVAKIADDYLERVKLRLRRVPRLEQEEFLREIESHVYEAFQQTTEEDDVARILAVLRKLGEPAEVVADRLPSAMVRSGTKRSLPLHLLSGILIAFFGIPLGFGGVGVLMGILATLSGMVVAYFAASGAVLLTGAMFLVSGLTRIYQPELWDRLVTTGFIEMDGMPQLLQQLPASTQGALMLALAGAFIAAGVGMLLAGRYLVRGIRFLFSVIFDWLRKFAESARRRLRQSKVNGLDVGEVSFVK